MILQERNLLEKYLNQNNDFLSTLSFAGVAAWENFFRFDFQMIDECLCVFAHNELGCFQYFPPLGDRWDSETIHKCFRYMREHNGSGGVSRIENVSFKYLHLFQRQYFQFYQKGHEYCYYKNDIVEMKGGRFKSKRSSFNQFVKNNKCEYIPYHPNMEGQCLDLYQRWKQERFYAVDDDIYRHMLEENEKVHQLGMKSSDQFNLIGRVVYANGKIEAYSFGYPLNEKIFCILFEVANLSIKGLPTFIFRKFCSDPQIRRYTYINVMDDFQMQGVRQAKLSFRPTLLIPSYSITQR